MNQSILPESFEENTIRHMLPGDVGYTVPWAMWADTDRCLWINGKYSVDSTPGGTVCMFIKRTEDGVIVYQNTIGTHRYSPVEQPGFVGGADPLPVALR